MVDGNGATLSWLGGYYHSTYNAMLISAGNAGDARPTTIGITANADAGSAAETNISSVQGAKFSFVSANVDASANAFISISR